MVLVYSRSKGSDHHRYLLSVHRHGVVIFSIFWSFGNIALTGHRINTAFKAGAIEGVRFFTLSISSHEQTQLNRVYCFLI